MGTGILSATKSFPFSPQLPLGGSWGKKHKDLLNPQGYCVTATAVNTEAVPALCLLPLRSNVPEVEDKMSETSYDFVVQGERKGHGTELSQVPGGAGYKS